MPSGGKGDIIGNAGRIGLEDNRLRHGPPSGRHPTSLRKDRTLREYLVKVKDSDVWSLRTAFRHLTACRIVGIDLDDGWIKRLTSSETRNGCGLKDLYYVERPA